MVRVAICYWGMTRSIRIIHNAHKNQIFDIFKNNQVEYDVYMHTWKTAQNFIWGVDWTTTKNIPNDYNEYRLLNPSYYEIDEQDDFLNTVNFSDYFKQELYDTYGDHPDYEWRPELIRNMICALESQKRVTQMCIDSQKKYDFVLYIRPDVDIYTPFLLEWFDLVKTGEIALTNETYRHFEGYNDKFALMRFDDCKLYAHRLDWLKSYRDTKGRIVAEKYLKYIIEKNFSNIHFVNMTVRLIRPQ
jgi:hypothetical protein